MTKCIRAARSLVTCPLVFVVLCGTVTSGCGYTLAGRGSFLPEYIKTIGVPTFTNRTPIFNVETQLTQKVRSEFIGRGHYRIVPEATGVDALLTGDVTGVSITPVTINVGARYMLTMSARVELRDVRENKVLWENPSLVFQEEFDAQTGQVNIDPTAYFAQDANALERITSNFARTIVSAILEAF
jgi:hypothetical protein